MRRDYNPSIFCLLLFVICKDISKINQLIIQNSPHTLLLHVYGSVAPSRYANLSTISSIQPNSNSLMTRSTKTATSGRYRQEIRQLQSLDGDSKGDTKDGPCHSHRNRAVYPYRDSQCSVDRGDIDKCLTLPNNGIPEIPCKSVLVVDMNQVYSHDVVMQALGDKDSSSYHDPPMMIRIVIHNIDPKQFDEMKVEQDIDMFLTYRPWWKLLHDSSGHSKSASKEYVIVFERYPFSWRPYLDFIVKTQYISEEDCARTPMIIGRAAGIHPGLTPIFKCLSGIKRHYGYAVFLYYWPIENAFVSVDEPFCRNSSRDIQSNGKNLISCAFLPQTNCYTPQAVLDCTKRDCLEQFVPTIECATAAERSTIKGQLVPVIDKEPTKYGRIPFPHQTRLDLKPDTPSYKFILPYDRSVWQINNQKYYVAMDSSDGLFLYLFLLRPNAFYRSKMKALIHEMRMESPHLYPTTPCVAVHLRRGDRIKVGINMTEYCYNKTHDADPNNVVKFGCQNVDHPERFGPCGGEVIDDLGCGSVPFASITLEHVISKIPRLLYPPVHDLLVFSDDPMYIRKQAKSIAKTHPSWRVHTLKAPEIPSHIDMSKIDESYDTYSEAIKHIRSAAGTESGVMFQTSLRMAQQCSAFIGHFGSAVPTLFFHAMCVEHAGYYGICPPVYDFRLGL